MGHITQTKQASSKSGGPQYYLQGLDTQTKAFLSHVGSCPVWMGTPYGVVNTGLVAVSKRIGKVEHDRLQRQEARYSVEKELKKWFCLAESDQMYKLDFRERAYHSPATKKDALLLFPERIEFSNAPRKRLLLDPHPLTFTAHHQSLLITQHLETVARTSRQDLSWSREQIGRILQDHLNGNIKYLGEEDLLRTSGALNKLGIQLDAYRRKGLDCLESYFHFLKYPQYGCAVEIKKRSSGFDYQILRKTTPERATVLCLEHDAAYGLPDVVDIIELRALYGHLSQRLKQ